MKLDNNFPISARVEAISAEARDVITYTIVAQNGGALPSAGPGAHIEVRLPNGLLRHYSLVNDCDTADSYVVAVSQPADSRGGSSYIHAHFRVDTPVEITGVRNNFQLDTGAAAFCFVAGGIGITPIMSMIRWCRQNDRPWRLIYAARSRQRAAFYEELSQIGTGQVRFHFDDEEGSFLDVANSLTDLAADEQIYCCGPEPLMSAVKDCTAYLPKGSVVFEWFAAPEDEGAADTDEAAITVKLKRSNKTLEVPAGQSILDAIEEAGLEPPFSCRDGVCGTCTTKVLAGDPDHRDHVLSTEEQAKGDRMMICVSRARSRNLVLDL